MKAVKAAAALVSAVLFFAAPVRADGDFKGRNIVLVQVREIGLKSYPRGQDFTYIFEPGQPPDPPYNAKFRVVKIYAGHLRLRRLHFSFASAMHTTTQYLVIDATDQAHPELLSSEGVDIGYCPRRKEMRDYGLEAAMERAQNDDPCKMSVSR